MERPRNDCFAPVGELMRLDEALELLAANVEPVIGTETVSLRAALNRFSAEDVTAPADVPPHDNAAVDGFVVFFADLDPDGETRLPVTGRIAAGHPLDRPARRGEALRIFTGAPVPNGPDTVFMQEDCRLDGESVILPPGAKMGANRRKAGEDLKAGAAAIRAGRRLRAQEIGLAASMGKARLQVRRRLKAAVFSTGDEVRDPDGALEPGCIFDSNRYAIMGLLDGLGCEVTDLGILPDSLEAIRGALASAATGHDLLITSGGVSVGDEDHVRAAVATLGSLHFWRLAVKPGRPLAFGRVGETVFVGLPGNPVAAMVTFMRIARPVILLMAGCSDVAPPLFQVRAGFDHKKKPGRREWLRARLVVGANGEPSAVKYPADGSGILTSMVDADGLVELAEDMGPISAGEIVDFLSFNEVWR